MTSPTMSAPPASDSSHAAERRTDREYAVVLFLALVIVAIVLGLVGAVAHGLAFLLVIGIVLFAADLAYLALRWRRSGRRPVR